MTKADPAFKRMKFNPFAVEDGNKLSDKYPELKRIQAMHESRRNDIEKLQRYIVICYSNDSPVFKTYRDVNQRKRMAFTLAGYELVNNDILSDPRTEKIATVSEDTVAEMITQFLNLTQPRLYQQAMIFEQLYYEYSLQIIKKTSGKTVGKKVSMVDSEVITAMNNKTKLVEALDKLSDKIDAVYEKITQGDVDATNAIERQIRWNPEGVARMIKEADIKII